MKPWITLVDSDKKDTEGTLGEATLEQLHDCASLLALSVVNHRAKFGVVPFEQSASELSAAKLGTGSADLLKEARQTLEEALKVIKAISRKPADKPPEEKVEKVKLERKRQQIRINVSAPVYVLPAMETTPIKAKLENISWGGAALHTEYSIGKVGDFIRVVLPSYRGRQITVQAEILRVWDVADEKGYGVRFSKVRTVDEEALQQLLEFLAESGDTSGQRENARLTQRIDIQYDDASEFQVTLEDISAGGLGITVPEPMEIDQSLLAAISTTDEQCELLLRARVVRQQEISFSNITMYRVGLKFEHPTEDIKERVNSMIRKMTTVNLSANFTL